MTLPDPAVSYDVTEGMWRLKEAYFFETEEFGFVIPPGFLFDLASVPRAAWVLIAPFELSVAAPLVHDYLYRYAGRPIWIRASGRTQVNRKESDGYFRAMMRERGVPGWRRGPAHLAVRLFGWWRAWDGERLHSNGKRSG